MASARGSAAAALEEADLAVLVVEDHGIGIRHFRRMHSALQMGHAAKVVQREQDVRRQAQRSQRLAAQLAEGSPGQAIEMDVEAAAQFRRQALRILERAARGQGFAQLFADTAALSKDRETSFEEQLGVFYGLLTDLLELTSKLKEPVLRNAALARELESLSSSIDSAWVFQAIAGFDELHAGLRRNLNRQLGLDALAASLAPGLRSSSAQQR